ncbi:hypothetical protein ACLKZ7_02340 [Shewanella algae]|uniref:hypothetical protein n=1 Tax=Shewanella algae TaxID=38313 RepID=UPI001AAD4EFE|nr:hypothetical protein [Shewanella algae]MBO2552370.1 hypothetical protein [Shewanella algae]
MKYKVKTWLETQFGTPSRQTQKLLAWHIRPGFSAALQLDQPADDTHSGSDSYALLWLPVTAAKDLPDSIKQRLYCEGEGRHSNTYASPGLGKGQSVIRLHIENSLQLEQLDKALFEGNKSGM